MNLEELYKNVDSQQTLAMFLKELYRDFANHPENWENDTLERFLEALSAWTEDMDGFFHNQGKPVPTQPDWKLFADMLLAAKIYE